VYKARDVRLDRLIALKFLADSLVESAEAHDRAFAEARAIASLNHPNIATIYEFGETANGPVLVLEYLPGGTLRSRMDAQTLSSVDIVEFGLQIADGLAHAHRHEIVHGDVKPENLMVSTEA